MLLLTVALAELTASALGRSGSIGAIHDGIGFVKFGRDDSLRKMVLPP
jgi:hypothetical protein